ncbi:MAG: phytanoyl-CoA dioxygenase family protein [Aliishimia sp.]
MNLARDGFVQFGYDPKLAAWARAALDATMGIATDPVLQQDNLRHGRTWFVGVDMLPNAPDGSVNGVPLAGPWQSHVPELALHKAQLSIIYPGYPQQDADESDANHRYRIARGAAHVDGLLPIGPTRRRFAQEFHAYILGIPLNDCAAAPTLVWPGSHKVVGPALREVIADAAPSSVDLTETYHAARRDVFASSEPIALTAKPGECFLIHRHALHGTAPWGDASPVSEGRMIAFLRPEFANPSDWL